VRAEELQELELGYGVAPTTDVHRREELLNVRVHVEIDLQGQLTQGSD